MTEPLTCRAIADRHNLHLAGQNSATWRGDCPACHYACTFTVKQGGNGRPLLFCANCRDGDALAAAIGAEPVQPDPKAEAAEAAKRACRQAKALALWLGAEPVPGTPAAIYLAGRHIGDLVDCPELRFRGDTPHPDGSRYPAMIAAVRDVAGELLGVHRTYLRRDGTGKARVEPAKASLGPIWGGAIRLGHWVEGGCLDWAGPAGAPLAIGEGIETAAAAGRLTRLPAWAAISAGNMAAGLVLPPAVRSVVIAVDRDAAGERAAADAAARWQAEGRRVRLLRPDKPGQDASDVLAARLADEAAMRAGFYAAKCEIAAREAGHVG